MHNLARILLVHFSAALSTPTIFQKLDFENALQCICALVQFHQMCEYQSHTDETIQYLEGYLADFHKYKSVFLSCRTMAKTNAQISTVKNQFKEWISGAQAQAITQTAKSRVREHLEQKLQDTIGGLVAEQAYFSFPKIHLLRHFGRYNPRCSPYWRSILTLNPRFIRRFGNLKQYSTEFLESAHRQLVKDAYNHSNKHIDIMNQIIAANDRMNIFNMRELNL
jgi:hypothetical protein